MSAARPPSATFSPRFIPPAEYILLKRRSKPQLRHASPAYRRFRPPSRFTGLCAFSNLKPRFSRIGKNIVDMRVELALLLMTLAYIFAESAPEADITASPAQPFYACAPF